MPLSHVENDVITPKVTGSAVERLDELVQRRVPLNRYMQGKLVVHVETFSKFTARLIMTGMIIGTAIVTTPLCQFPGENTILHGLALNVFVVLLMVGARISWGVLHPPRRPYVG